MCVAQESGQNKQPSPTNPMSNNNNKIDKEDMENDGLSVAGLTSLVGNTMWSD